jgi:hypothetical protein
MLNHNHFLKDGLGVGQGSNTKEELLVVWALLLVARTLNISNLVVGWDSKCVIDWLNKKADLQVLNLSYWKAKVEGFLKEF